MNWKKLFVVALFGGAKTMVGQIEGDRLFGADQVVTMELTFHQTGFWDSLVTNYSLETYMKADLVITDATGTVAFTDIGVRFKGNSTYNHPNNKKPFKFDFNEYVTGQNYDGLKKLNLSNNFKDPSMMREKLFFDFCREMGVKAPRANFTNLYINGELYGLYTVVEQVDDQFLDWAILEDSGNLFKAGDNFAGGGGAADLVYYSADTADYTDRYELKTNETANDWSDLLSLIDYINNSSDADFAAQFDTRFESGRLIRSIALDNLFSNLDSYTGSARNYYLYHNMDTDRWEWIKWDANEAFGSYANGQTTPTLAIDYHNTQRPLLDRVFGINEIYETYKSDLCLLANDYFTNAYLDPKIDALYALIQSAAYADTKKMYTSAQFDQNITSNVTSGGPMGNTIYGLKSFIQTRQSSVLGQINCTNYASIDELTAGDLSIYPNPATDQFTVVFSNNTTGGMVHLYSAEGTLMRSEFISEGQEMASIDVKDLASGIYLLSFETATGMVTERVAVQR